MQINTYYSEIKRIRQQQANKNETIYLILLAAVFWFVTLLAIFTN